MRLKSVVYPTRDMDAAQHFYATLLGLPAAFRDGARWSQFAPPGGTFALAAAAEVPDGARGPIATFEVDALDALAATLRAAGVAVIAERDMGAHGRTVTVADPDGNFVHLFQRA